MHLDERMMDMEFQHLSEDKVRKKCQRREERGFQLRMTTMMMSQLGDMGSLSAPSAPT